MNAFEQAVRQQLRFDFKGSISVEQLFNMRRTSALKEELITYEEELQKKVESFGRNSRRTSSYKTSEQKLTELSLVLVSLLLDEIENDEKVAKEKSANSLKKQELLAIKAQKQLEAMREMSIDEIDAQIKALE